MEPSPLLLPSCSTNGKLLLRLLLPPSCPFRVTAQLAPEAYLHFTNRGGFPQPGSCSYVPPTPTPTPHHPNFLCRYRPDCVLEFPRGGSQAMVGALVRGLEKHGGRLLLSSHVEEVLLERGRAAGEPACCRHEPRPACSKHAPRMCCPIRVVALLSKGSQVSPLPAACRHIMQACGCGAVAPCVQLGRWSPMPAPPTCCASCHRKLCRPLGGAAWRMRR
jgi:hypothetical protein